MNDKLYWYRARLLRVVDGDTLDLEIDLGLKIFVRERIRLFGIDTPEIFGIKKESEEYQRGMAAKEFVEELLKDKAIWIKTYKDKTGKFGRYLADVHIQDEEGRHVSVAKRLLDEGLANEY